MGNILQEVQDYVVGKLSADYQLSGNCTFLAENKKDIDYEIKNALGRQGIVGVVMTPRATYAGKYEDLFLAWTLEELEIDIVENPVVNRGKKTGYMTGQDIGMRVFDVLCPLSGDFEGQFCPQTIEEGEDGNLIVNKCVLKALVYGEHGDVPQPEKPITYQFVKLLDQPPPLSVQPHDGWMWQDADGLYFYVDHVAHKLGDVSSEQLSAYVESQVSSKVEISAFNELQNSLSNYYTKSETSSNVELNTAFETVQDSIDDIGNSLSDYYTKSETSSASEISIALDGKQPTGDYALTSQLPTKTSQLSNDSGYITSSQVTPAQSTLYRGAADKSVWSMWLAGKNNDGQIDKEKFLTFRNGTATLAIAENVYGSWYLSMYNGTTFDPPTEMTFGYRFTIKVRVGNRIRTWGVDSYCWYGGRYIIKAEKGEDDTYYRPTTFGWLATSPTTQIDWYETTYTDTLSTTIATVSGSNDISCSRNEFRPTQFQRDVAFTDELSAKADISALNVVESSLSNYYTKNETSSATEIQEALNNVSVDLSEYYTKSETSSNAEISTALNLKQDKLTDEQMANVNTKCLPLNLSGNTEISGNQYLDFRCLARFFSPVVMNGALDVQQLNIVNYDVDSYTALSAMDEDTLGFVGGFNREQRTFRIQNRRFLPRLICQLQKAL